MIDLNDDFDSDGKDTVRKRKYRLIMRADAVHKVILNVPILEALISTYGERGNPPTGNNFKLLGHEDGSESLLLIKVSLVMFL